MALGRIRFDTRRFGSAENKPDVMACTTSGWTLAVSKNRATGSFLKLLTQCFGHRKAAKILHISDRCFANGSNRPVFTAVGGSYWEQSVVYPWLNTSRAYRATIGRVLLLERQSIR
jgi:hypothetical protein